MSTPAVAGSGAKLRIADMNKIECFYWNPLSISELHQNSPDTALGRVFQYSGL